MFRRYIMRLVLLALGAAMVAATPALAGEARVEVRSGVDWTGGQSAKGVVGAAAGYDWTLPGGAFVGAEESIDKTLTSGAHVRWGSSGRIGLHVTPTDKLYATAGYNYGKGPNATDVGAGWEHSFGPMYGKVEYKRFFNEDGVRDNNAALVGVGMHF
jgi:outer membrane immunogenic protein